MGLWVLNKLCKTKSVLYHFHVKAEIWSCLWSNAVTISVTFKGFVFYFINPCWGEISFAETVKALSPSKNPEAPIFFQVFLRNVFYHNSCWPCFIIGNRIRVHVIATSVYVELGMRNAGLFCLFYLIKYSWGSECMCSFLYCDLGLSWKPATTELYPKLKRKLLYLHCSGFPGFRMEVVAFSWSSLFCYEKELLHVEALGN